MIYSKITESTRLWRYSLYSALIKITLRNAGSKLGLIWEPLSTLLVAGVLSAVWIKVLGVEGRFIDYFVYVYCGMVVWGCIASSVANLCATLIKNAKGITNRNLPIYSYIFEEVIISFVPFILSLPFLLALILYSGHFPSIGNVLVFIAGFTLMLVSSFAFAISIGLWAFFVGDIRQIVTAVMRLGFLVTPVIWKAERLGDSQYLLMLNPFYGYLHVIRGSLIGTEIQSMYVIQAIVVTVVLLMLGFIVLKTMHGKIQYRALMI